jgi:hypothetical protein
MIALTASAGMVTPPVPLAAGYNAYVLRRAVRPGDPPPCQRLNDGSGVYVIRGNPGGLDAQLLRNPGNAAQRYELVCPGRRSITWP